MCLYLLLLANCRTVESQPVNGAPAGNSHTADASTRLAIGIAPGTWHGLNQNDVTAAMAAWAKSILNQRSISITVDAVLFDSTLDLANALVERRIDCASMLTDQFFTLDPSLRPDEIFIAVNNHTSTERYLLLCRQDGDIHGVTNLLRRKLTCQTTSRTSLAPMWLDTLLADHRLGSAQSVLAEFIQAEKPSKAILPVFFKKADACLVTSNAFVVASELNPQLKKELKVLAVSPAVVPSLFFFRRDHLSKAREQLEPAILELHESVAGRQVLTVFQCNQMVKCAVASLGSTQELLSRCPPIIDRQSAGHTQSGSLPDSVAKTNKPFAVSEREKIRGSHDNGKL